MADPVNRMVLSSVAMGRTSWRRRERKEKPSKETSAERLSPDETVTTNGTGATEPGRTDIDVGK
jgi:hypothetical protein